MRNMHGEHIHSAGLAVTITDLRLVQSTHEIPTIQMGKTSTHGERLQFLDGKNMTKHQNK